MTDGWLLIGGRATAAAGGRTFTRLNPVTGRCASEAAAASASDAILAAEAAAEAFPGWAATGPRARRTALLRAAEALSHRRVDIVAAMRGELGATDGWANFNVDLAVTFLEEAASLTTQIGGEMMPSNHAGRLALAVRQPVGVVLGIAPWNAPVILAVRAAATPLACGNTVVLKGSELCPRTHFLVADTLQEALPPGVINLISNDPVDAKAVVDALIDHRDVKRINFTGSTRVGKLIAERAASHLKPVLLELGGKAPLVVLDDADLEEAVKAAAFGAFMNQGQICMSTERIVVLEPVADRFVELLTEKANSLRSADPATGGAQLGALVGAPAAEHVRSLVQDAVANGAAFTTKAPLAAGVVLPAAVVDRVTPSMRLYHEESFGPIVAVTRVPNEDEAVRVANDTMYGLTAAVFTRDVPRGLRIASRIHSGMCHINGPTVQDEPQMPFGGMKASGYGRFGGKAGVSEFTELRWVTIATQPQYYPI